MNYQYDCHDRMNSIINITGPPKDIEDLRQQGLSIPRIDIGNSIWKYSITTGNMTNEKTYPFSIVYEAIKLDKIQNGKKSTEFLPLSGSTIKGFVNQSKRLIIDTIITENSRADLNPLANNLINHGDTFPSLKVKIGDTFQLKSKQVKTPVISFIITKTFKLKKINNDLAYFRVYQDFSIDKELFPNARIKGSGKGMYIFDPKYNFFIRQNDWYNILILDNIGDLKIKQKMSSESKTNSPVTKN